MSEDNAPDVAAIAARLTRAQQRWINRAVLGANGRFVLASSRMDHSIRVGLFRKALLQGGSNGFDALTPLGVALRQHLMEKNDVQG